MLGFLREAHFLQQAPPLRTGHPAQLGGTISGRGVPEPEVPFRIDDLGAQEDRHGNLLLFEERQEIVISDVPIVEGQDQTLGGQAAIVGFALANESLQIEKMVSRGETVERSGGGFPGDIMEEQDGNAASLNQLADQQRQAGESQDFEEKRPFRHGFAVLPGPSLAGHRRLAQDTLFRQA
jgi:hypothetical protein